AGRGEEHTAGQGCRAAELIRPESGGKSCASAFRTAMGKARLRQCSFCRRNRIFRRRLAECAAYFLGAWLAGAEPLLAFQTPLSEEAVREAYFLGQRHDESVTSALEKYSQYFSIPDHGPQIASVTYLTPFAQAILASSNHIGNYSAQQAQ